MRIVLIVGLALSMALAAAAPQQTGGPEVLLGQGIHQEEAEGDLEAAIATYTDFLKQYGDNRALAAQALLRLGGCYEKLGQEEARATYERVVREYPDQTELAQIARANLARLSSTERAAQARQASGMTLRQVFVAPTGMIDTSGEQGEVCSDGRYLTFVEGRNYDLMVRDLATGENRRLVQGHPAREHGVDESRVSPDCTQIAYQWDNSEGFDELRIIGIDGSGQHVLYRNEEVPHIHPRGWLPGGEHIVVSTELRDETNQLALVSVADGSMRVLKALDQQTEMSVSPDGRYVVYEFYPEPGGSSQEDQEDIALFAIDGSGETLLVTHPADDDVLSWTPDGNGVLFRSERTGYDSLWWIQVVDGKPQGAPQLIKEDLGPIIPWGFTREGTFYYAAIRGMVDVYVATLDPASSKVVTPPKPFLESFVGANSGPDWSLDGRYLAYVSERGEGRNVIVVRSLETGEEREFLPEFSPRRGARYPALRWSPDGRFILFRGFGADTGEGIFRLEVETGAVTAVVPASRELGISGFRQWSPDGTHIYYSFRRLQTSSEHILRRDLKTGQETELVSGVEPNGVGVFALSPDGRSLVYGPGLGSNSLQVVSTAGGEPRELLRVEEPEIIRPPFAWTPDGRYLIFAKGRQGQTERDLWRIPAAGGEPERLGWGIDRSAIHLRFHPDGRRVAFSVLKEVNEIWALENFLPEPPTAE